MKNSAALAFVICVLLFSACSKKKETAAPNTPDPAATTQSSAPTPDASQGDTERAQKQALLDYATMEDQYINDPHAQWAIAATASSVYGGNEAVNATGPVDGQEWTNGQQDIGFDWLQLEFTKPVKATEVRVVFGEGGRGAGAVSKVEVEDVGGHWTTAWSGLSDVKIDQRGARTWFVRKFNQTPTLTKGVKITIANNVETGFKNVDAVQLVGE